MPRSMARFSAARALSSSWYIRKRLPHPNARIETVAPVRPSVREGSGPAPAGRAAATSLSSDKLAPAAVPKPTRSRNFLRERSLLMVVSLMNPNDGESKDEFSPHLAFRNLAQPGGG